MMLIEELRLHENKDNKGYIEELIDIINEDNINSLEELDKYEKGSITEDYSIDEKIKKCIHLIDTYPFEYDGLLSKDIQELKNERKLMDEGTLEDCILHIVKYYYLTNRDNPFPYQTYKFIIQDKL